MDYMKKSTKKEITVLDHFVISLKLGDDTHVGRGKTALDALLAIPLSPHDIFLDGVFAITHGEQKHESYMTCPKIRQLFQPLRHVLFEDQMSVLLNSK